MRSEDGVYLGEDQCMNWNGIERIEERTCCGGKVAKFAFVKCQKHDIVLADIICMNNCKERELSITMRKI